MNALHVAGQVITSTNYATPRIFNFNPDPVRQAAENFLASGVVEIEIPEAVADPDNRFKDTTGLDVERIEQTVAALPAETQVVGTYLGSKFLDSEPGRFVDAACRRLEALTRYFPAMRYAMLHPPGARETVDRAFVRQTVDAWAQVARHVAGIRPGFQCCLHNHYDSACETEAQVCAFLDEMAHIDEPALRWGPDTGHTHGVGDAYLKVFDTYAPLVGNTFHIKARVAAFDSRHGGDAYAADRDIWGNKAEFGRGLYGGFVNCADPEIETPLAEVFDILRRKARPDDGVVTGAVEIDVPRQHPRLEILCSTLYLVNVHGLSTGMPLDNDDRIRRVFDA